MTTLGIAMALSLGVTFGIVFDNFIIGLLIAIPFLFVFNEDDEE